VQVTEPEASLIIRMHLALTDEGIGPKRRAFSGDPVDPAVDEAVLAEAVRVAGHLFDEHLDLWDSGLIPDDVHFPRCTEYRHAV
jgi:hypothetical protein